MSVHVARPQSIGAWTFVVREDDEHGQVVSSVALEGLRDSGRIAVGEVPFEIERTTLTGPHTLRFEGQPLAQATPTGTLSPGYRITVEGALLAQDVPLGDRVVFAFAPPSLLASSYRLTLDGELWGEVVRESALFRHFVLPFKPGIPLALQSFCLGLVLSRLRRQSRG